MLAALGIGTVILGAVVSVPSVEYSYSFDKDLEQEWNWTEIMAAQPEILEYANHVADRFDLRDDIKFQTRVVSTVFDESCSRWKVKTDRGEEYTARFCVMATGCLSVPNTPSIDGQEEFAGPVYHTGNWPEGGVDFSNWVVGLIGTGSSGIQSIPVIAEQAKHLTVFQRTPNYTMPAANAPLKADFLQQAKATIWHSRRTALLKSGLWATVLVLAVLKTLSPLKK